MIIQHPGRMTNKAAYQFLQAIPTTRIENVSCLRYQDGVNGIPGLKIREIPNAKRLVKYECAPSLWIYLDTETGSTFHVFSDCQNKEFRRGTSIEYVMPYHQNYDEAFGRLLVHLGLKLY